MSPIYLYDGKILVRNNKIATNENCCCIITPTNTPTPTSTPIFGFGCDCIVSTAQVCSSVTWTINNIYDNGGNQFNATDTVQFPGLNHFYIFNGAVNAWVTFSYQCVVVNKALSIDLGVSLLFDNGATSYFCKPIGDPNNFPYNGQTWTLNIGIPENLCDQNGFVDLSGNYNLNEFGNNCPFGDTTFQATWSISQPPCP
jgi:hypothetical protein